MRRICPLTRSIFHRTYKFFGFVGGSFYCRGHCGTLGFGNVRQNIVGKRHEFRRTAYANAYSLKIFGFNFRNDVLPVEFSVRSEGGIKYFESQDISNSNPMVTKVWGDILSTIIQIEHEVESAFGDPTVNVTTRTIRSWDVIGASAEPMEWDDDSTITKAELKQKLSEREERLADQKKRDEEYRNSQSGKSGFPTSTTPSQVEEDDDDDFPF